MNYGIWALRIAIFVFGYAIGSIITMLIAMKAIRDEHKEREN